MNWIKRLFSKKPDTKELVGNKKISNHVFSSDYSSRNGSSKSGGFAGSQRNSLDYLADPTNPISPLSPFSVWNTSNDAPTESHSNHSHSDSYHSHDYGSSHSSYDSHSHYDSGHSDSTSYDSGSYDSGSSSSDW